MISNVAVYGLEQSIRRSKFPMSTDVSTLTEEVTPRVNSLAGADKGSGHDCFLKGIIVQFDLTFTIKAWTEGERYNWFDIISSQSTMHRITKFDLDKAYINYVDSRIVDIMKEKVAEYNYLASNKPSESATKEEKTAWENMLAEKYLGILYSNPCGFKLTAGMTTNYLQLKTIYAQRKYHRLPEWKEFCKWIKTLPHSEFITGKKENTND